ncbi:hypothetical protein [Ideonella sp. BN130291]|uniref:hypothetical protein n=1 Tax=Ideonella sp. BN130291 TaxID=3112940 RepID=UPI002E270C22|nr:hypothetical protein [Ideonella sp. BN130291]
MQAATLPRPIPLSRPLPVRWLQSVAAASKSAWAALAAAVAGRAHDVREVWDLDTATGLSDRTLRDIGAPDWLRVEAAARRDADHVSVVELRVGSTGLFDRSAF